MRAILVTAGLLVMALPLFGQGPELVGIGLSGSESAYDTTVVNGRQMYIVGECTMDPDMDFVGVHYASDYVDRVLVRYYDSVRPDTADIGSNLLAVSPEGITSHTHDDTTDFSFAVALPAGIDPSVLSLQLQFGVVATADTGGLIYGPMRTSHAAAHGYEPCLNPVDTLHETFLRVEFDHETETPSIREPDIGQRIGQVTGVKYDQPEAALPGSPALTFRRIGGAQDPYSPHVVYLSDPSAGSDKQITLDLTQLSESAGVDSVGGGDFLVHEAYYDLEFGYRDVVGNPPAADTVSGLFADVLTETPEFIDPASGSASQADNVPVRYVLPEEASVVTLIFERTGGDEDPASPHELTLWDGGLHAGETSFWLDGTNIGTLNPYIAGNPHGEVDSLMRMDYTATIYDVTFRYQDLLGNPPVEMIHTGFVFGVDSATAPPILHLPRRNTADNASFTLRFTLPEAPLDSSVKVHIYEEVSESVWRGRTLVLGTTIGAGTYTIVLDGEDLPGSNFVMDIHYTDGDTSYSHLLDGHLYSVYMSYRDAIGHDSVMSNVADSVSYDNATILPTIDSPVNGMTFGSDGLTVSYMLEERPLAGSLRLGLRQTAGEMPDHDSPHLFYPSFDSPGWYEILLRPLDLQASDGLDSLDAGPTLVPNSVYELTVECQDTIENPVASVVISGLTYMTGATIYARGAIPVGGGIVDPGMEDVALFRLSLRAAGEIGLFRGASFDVTGDATSSDFVPNSITLWLSQDSVFDAAADVPLATLADWTPPISFSGFSTPIDTIERHYFLTASFDSLADASHRFSINVTDATRLDCGGDPIYATNWPLVMQDVAVDVEVASFEARTDSSFGTLLLVWHVASERDNDGFNIWRSEAPDTGFVRIAHYLEDPSLEGIGDHVWGYRYSWLDRDVEIGRTYYYRLESVSLSGLHTFYEEVAFGTPLAPPSDYILLQNHPNPFNAMTTIEYLVPRSSRVWLTVYDILGRKVRTLADGRVHSPAVYRVNWHGRDDSGQSVASGIYFYQLRGERGFRTSRKMVFLQ